MKITVLAENTSCREDLVCEHGLSLYIETDDLRILFDTGKTHAFAENAEKLGIELKSVDFAVLSHGHYDHGGGLQRFLERNATAPVYVSRQAFGSHYNGTEKYIGLDPALSGHPRLVPVDRIQRIAPGITLHPGATLPCPHGIQSYGLTYLEEGCFLPDTFPHEQYLTIAEKGQTVLFSGCSHKGILNITGHFRPDILVGGFHFMKLDPIADAGVLSQAADVLLRFPTVYHTGHCTGPSQFAFLKERMGDKLHPLSTGTVIEI
jgi:7,8-dihydropterin-6-yl-methyl-4-(beta-D-ribofuranosyl)aminobenzene 5'-phosphate synthase